MRNPPAAAKASRWRVGLEGADIVVRPDLKG